MKKLFYFAAAAVALAACAKNEVIPVNSGENKEITFNVAPRTKATTAFDKNFKFKSYAYYLPSGETWASHTTTPSLYIDGAVISNTNPAGTDGFWKAADKTYYWPKDGGKLTFFAYSLNKGDLDLTSGPGIHEGFTCTHDNGITGQIDLQLNPNTDFLVADIANDKTSNETNGVPTLFRHRLSSVVFAIKTVANYADKAFKLTEITFHNLSYDCTYGQLPNEYLMPGTNKYNPVYATSIFQEITPEFKNVTGVDKIIFIPQTFTQGSDANQNAYIEVKYTITSSKTITNTGGQKVKQDIVTENVTKQIFLNPADGEGTKMFDSWDMGKKYTINLTFTLDEILWAPAVKDWEPVTPATDRIVE